jgi:DNA-directed RNA polymerase subunit RPC12/RpoP
MSLENPEKIVEYICPECLAVFHLDVQESEEKIDDLMTCLYCGTRLKRGENGGEE